jgi:hypothetical protein
LTPKIVGKIKTPPRAAALGAAMYPNRSGPLSVLLSIDMAWCPRSTNERTIAFAFSAGKTAGCLSRRNDV